MCQFNAELMLLRHQKLRLDWQLKMANLRQLTLYQELLLLKEFERREDSLQEKFNTRLKEECSITVKGPYQCFFCFSFNIVVTNYIPT